MEQFLGLSRDASREKAEVGTSPYNKNIRYNKKLGSITQEDGFDFSHQIPGIVIGTYSSNTHIVYITYDTNTARTIISYVDTTTNVITVVLDTIYFNYEPSRPIEIIGWYNYNQELLIMFSDGVFEKSSAPRLINLMDIGVELNNNKEFLSQRDADFTLLFSTIIPPLFSIKYGNKATHDADLLFFTIAYVLPDGTTTTRFIQTLSEAFPLYAFKSEYKKEITFKIEDLDPFFNQFIIGIVAYRDNALFGYTTDPISFTNSTYEYFFNSVAELNSVSVDSIIIESSVFEKVKSLTIGNDCVILGGISNSVSNNYQKYANNLVLNLYFDERKDNRHQAPLLCPDEVYYFTIALAFNNGTFSEEFHIPNRDPEIEDLAILDKNVYGLVDLVETNIPSFRIINRGDWDNPSVGLPDFTDLPQVKLNWGYWQNDELYPNNEHYNGTVDYDNVTHLPFGRDLRGTNVKLHRVPGLDNLSKKFPMRIGKDIKNKQDTTVDDDHSRLPAFSISVDNFLTAFNTVIAKDNIVGYRLSFVKKDSSSKLVEDINFIKPLLEGAAFIVDQEEEVDYINNSYGDFNIYKNFAYYRYGFSKLKSINLSVYKGNSSSKIIKANYGIIPIQDTDIYLPVFGPRDKDNIYEKTYRNLSNDKETSGLKGVNFIMPSLLFKYATIQSIIQTAGNVKEEHNLFIHEQVKLKAKNSNTFFPVGMTIPFGWNPINYFPTFPISSFTTDLTLSIYNKISEDYVSTAISNKYLPFANISSTILNLKNNIHSGLQPNSFVVIGTTNLDNPVRLFKDFGDTFSNNIYNEIETVMYVPNSPIIDDKPIVNNINYFQQVYSGLLAIDNNTLIYFVKDKILGYAYNMNGESGRITDVPELLNFDYSTQITNKQNTRQLNTLISNVAFNFQKKYLNSFPYRIVKSLTIQSENLATTNVRTFLPNAYYDIPSIKGEIIYLVGFDKGVYCQQRYSLSIFQLKEKLSNNDENTAYLAEADLFAYKPQTILDEDNKGYIGSVHQFGKKLSKNGLITIDAERGKVYIINGSTPKEISKIKMENDFKEKLELLLQYIVPNLFNTNAIQDNPYNGNGILIGIDDKNNRILITFNNYIINPTQGVGMPITIKNGLPYDSNDVLLDIKLDSVSINKSKTLSFNIDWQRWVSEHDYYPQYYNNTNKFNYAGINKSPTTISGPSSLYRSDIYITNKENTKTGKYFYNTDTNTYESYTDLLFNSRYDLTKWYKSVLWRTTVKDSTLRNIYEKTINAILLYTDYQCSGRIELDTEQFNLVRNSEGIWNFNEFRDMVIDSNDLPIREDGSFDEGKVHLNRVWFEKSDFISNFIIIRLIMNNIENTRTHIHNVNVESRISNRI